VFDCSRAREYLDGALPSGDAEFFGAQNYWNPLRISDPYFSIAYKALTLGIKRTNVSRKTGKDCF
jgi:hypothetical protein